jgi:hypothetical protein
MPVLRGDSNSVNIMSLPATCEEARNVRPLTFGNLCPLGLTVALLCVPLAVPAEAAARQKRYFAYPAVEDVHGDIAPWYTGQNGQCDLRVRIAAETLKRYPWVTRDRAIGVGPEYAFNSTWRIAPDGTITVPPMDDWTCGDRAQMCARVILAWVEYYRYSGDPAALAHIEVVGGLLLDGNLTDAAHPWPGFLISVPVSGKPYSKADPRGWIQLDIVAEAGFALLRAYEVTGDRRFLDAVTHWGEVLAAKRNRQPGAAPWPRYANPEQVTWAKAGTGNVQTGGLVYQLAMLDELIRLGIRGKQNQIVEARDAARAWLRDTLLPAWAINDTWGRNYWDWEDPVQSQTTTDWTARYLLANKDTFPNWQVDVRNILTLFLNHTSVNPASRAEVYSGAWAFPESSSCCGSSLAWGPMELALNFAQYGVEARSEWARELARRQQILATYDALETGVVEDNIDGGSIAAGGWLKGTHPSALEWVLRTMGWLPEVFGASRENHIMRSSAAVISVVYAKGRIAYMTFDAPQDTVDALRLAFKPDSITADGELLTERSDLGANGYTLKGLSDGDYIVFVRHDAHKNVVVEGPDPQSEIEAAQLRYQGNWVQTGRVDGVPSSSQASSAELRTATEPGASMSATFAGNQVRLIGPVGPQGGLAEVHLDGIRQLVGIDAWNPRSLHGQVLYYRNGLTPGDHQLRIVVRGRGNPLSKGTSVAIEAVRYSAARGTRDSGEGGGPTEAQRMIFGYTARTDYIDSKGNAWRPATEFVVRSGAGTDSVIGTWWTARRSSAIEGTQDPHLYGYGVHAPEIVINLTVAPGRYPIRLMFAETQYSQPGHRSMTVTINGEKLTDQLDVVAAAGKAGKAFDLVRPDVSPKHGVIEVRLRGNAVRGVQSEAIIQAIEVGPGGR